MKNFRNKNLLFYALLMLTTFTLVFISCKKHDLQLSSSSKQTRDFFEVPQSTDPIVKKVAAYLQTQPIGYINLIIANGGYPIWEKAVTNSNYNFIYDKPTIENANDIVIIPLVLNQNSKVNAFLKAEISADTTIVNLYRGKDYKNLTFGGISATSFSAEKMVHNLMVLNFLVNGNKLYKMTDTALFRANYPNNVSKAKVEFEIKTPKTAGRANTEMVTVTTSCIILKYGHCTTPDWCNIHGGCDWLTKSCDQCTGSVEICSDTYSSSGTGIYVPPAPTPSNSPNSPTGGSGGGNDISDGNVGLGWEPIDDEEHIRKIIDSLDGYPCAQEIIRLFPSCNDEVEKLINKVFNVNEDVNLFISMDKTLTIDSTDAYVKMPFRTSSFYEQNMKLNPWVFTNSSKEYMLVTIYHEAIHAYIQYNKYLLDYGKIDSITFKQKFPLFWDYKRALNNYELIQHQIMADNYINSMKDLLKSYNPNINDSLATAMAWGGLHETNMWKQKSDTAHLLRLNKKARGVDSSFNFQINSLTKCN